MKINNIMMKLKEKFVVKIMNVKIKVNLYKIVNVYLNVPENILNKQLDKYVVIHVNI